MADSGLMVPPGVAIVGRGDPTAPRSHEAQRAVLWKRNVAWQRITLDELTPELVAAVFTYDPGTGDFRWREGVNKRGGLVAGRRDYHGHRTVRICRRQVGVHRLIWLMVYGHWPRGHVDHANGVRDDNRLCNLRDATPSQNAANNCHSRGKSGYKGAQFRYGRWTAKASYGNRSLHLGTYDTPEDAARAYDKAARQLFGEFAVLNFPEELRGA